MNMNNKVDWAIVQKKDGYIRHTGSLYVDQLLDWTIEWSEDFETYWFKKQDCWFTWVENDIYRNT